VDLRYNGGGHVSQHLLKVLAQKILGFDETRYQGLERYPLYAPGALAALANEYSGSDGDIFPHSFKLMKLGPLIGKRTWGGVIGINGQYRLSDGTYVTQPEYSFWFKDNEWHVENHGVAPNIEVDITPEDYRDGRDPQLDRALAEIQRELKARPATKFKPSYYPDLSIPRKLTNKLTKLTR
jgi:tricorn protease